ncbi:diguanylate cyclase [Enterovibrio norvegicus FF-33]|uniref:diguanylate cyclase n=1 Tax=Enterovibrio norvegicus FF-454 TaxID=1185651 RepID=A0A1E5C1B9_9GAMM|nr:CHASE domain-containing protein [Enterovibrio norvegicus]OEE59279.1 diguanylate cyclase [Enterovibrio norvegicus FF-454]OEE67645.1 diguanylate cyclase [Enterovibrio norvegicus FF-33]OEE87499.1 diguanylate cyclase [Enterovibrio norvegicus FF-162]
MAKKVLYSTIITVLVGLFFSFLAAMSLHQSEQQSIKHEIQKDVENAALSLGRELNISIELLYALRTQLIMHQDIDETSFGRLADSVMDRHPNIRAMEWAEFVLGDERELYESEAALEFALFEIVELSANGDLVKATSRDRYFPVRYITPYDVNQRILGFDLASRQSMEEALEMSWYRGVPIATPAMRLKREFEDNSGFLMLLPVFYGDPETDADRQSALRGFLLALFDVEDIFELAINSTVKESINLELLDVGLNTQGDVIYQNVVDLSEPPVTALSYTSTPIYFAGREWLLKGTPSPSYVNSRMSIYPHLIFFIGVLIFTLLAYLLYMLQHRALTVQKHVDAKTRELREANKKLEKMSKSDGLTGYCNRDYFEECIQAEVKRTQRDNLAISLIVIEIDNMSRYNTKHGRVVGDKAIRLIGQAVSDTLKRPGDLLARYGGETFAILLPNTKDGAPIAQLCIDAVKTLKLPFDKEAGSQIMTISIGGVSVLNSDEIDATKVIAYAEIALGKAINAGRDQCSWIYTEESKQPPIGG